MYDVWAKLIGAFCFVIYIYFILLFSSSPLCLCFALFVFFFIKSTLCSEFYFGLVKCSLNVFDWINWCTWGNCKLLVVHCSRCLCFFYLIWPNWLFWIYDWTSDTIYNSKIVEILIEEESLSYLKCSIFFFRSFRKCPEQAIYVMH